MRLRNFYFPSLSGKSATSGKLLAGAFACALFTLFAVNPAQAQTSVSRTTSVYAGVSAGNGTPMDSVWTFDVTDYSVRTRVQATLSGFTISGMNGLATHPITGIHYVILKLNGVSGRVLATIDLQTGVCNQIGNLGDNFATLAFNANGTLFGVTGDGATVPETMYRISTDDASTTPFRALGNGADGEVITYCADNNYFYHWSGNGTVVWERFDTTGTDLIEDLLYMGTPTPNETFGALYLGNGDLLVSNISNEFAIWDTLGNITNMPTVDFPGSLRGLVRQTITSAITSAGVTNICAGTSVDLNVTGASGNYQWYMDGAAIPAATNATYAASAAGNYNCVYTDINGFTDSTATGIVVTVKPVPSLSSGTSPSAICDNTLFAYTATSTVSGTSFSWSRDLISGIANTAATGTSTISETLDNTSTDPIAVAYSYTLTADGCTSTEFVTVAVNPTPALFPTPLVGSICSGSTFTHLQNSLTIGTTYSWSRAAVTGISNVAANGTGNINEVLVNITPDPITVVYIDTLDINGCRNNETISVVVNPMPVLTSTLTPTSICDNATFDYDPASATVGTTFTWERATLAGIANPGVSGIDTINETLDNIFANPVTVTYVVGVHANGCNNFQNVNVIINPTPSLSSSLTPSAQCDSTIFNYPPTSNTTGATFAWSRIATDGISNPAASGTGNPGERLRNITSAPVVVTYVYTLGIDGCTNTENVVVTINPKPKLSNPMPSPICDSTVFTFTPVSTTLGTSYTWTRAFVSGIGALPGSGINNPNELLKNNTNSNITVTYVYTVSANGCDNIVNIPVVVRPTPRLLSLTDSACSGLPFNYTPTTSITHPVTYAWSRSSVANVSPLTSASTGTTGVINETLINATTSILDVTYVYTLTVGTGSTKECTNVQSLAVKLRPTAEAPVITTMPASTLCASTMYQNFGAADAPPVGRTYTWSASNATIQATGDNAQYSIVNFDVPGSEATITLSSTVGATGCVGVATYKVTVGNNTSAKPFVIFNSGKFICLKNDVKSFQWGYDDAHSLDSVILKGETAQSYFNKTASATFADRYYWVMTATEDGCTQKTYYSVPPGGKGVDDVNTGFAEMNIFPNPANDNINVEVKTAATGNITIELVNMMGQVVNTINTTTYKTAINIANLPAGIYMIDSYMEGVKIGAAKFVKN